MKEFFSLKNTSRWWKERFITLMVIPERTRRVHKFIIPFFIIKFGVGFLFLMAVFLFILSVDYLHVLGRVSENKKLKGENFKLRQELQQIKNKVEAMESTVDRVRNYAKKLQILTGQPNEKTALSGPSEINMEPEFNEGRSPASIPKLNKALKKPQKKSSLEKTEVKNVALSLPLDKRISDLEKVSINTEGDLSKLQIYLLTQKDIAAATPSLMPLNGWLSSTFGYRRHPYDGSYRLHSGIDISAESGTPVRSPADGYVIFSGVREGYGKVLVIDHNYGIHTIYGHNSELFVNVGDKVKRNQIISKVGSTGKSTGPHLHYEVRKWGKPIDPMSLLGG